MGDAVTRGSSLVALLCLSMGCSILNKPDEDHVIEEATDAGLDSSTMSDGGDSGTDSGDGGTDAGCTVEICGNDVDDDCDGLEDCSDFDCAGLSQCCREAAGETVLTEEWTAADPSIRWNITPPGAAFPMVSVVGSERRLSRFTPDEAIILRTCTPLALGLDVDIRFVPRASGSCSEDCHAQLYLTLTQYLAPGGGRPLEDLGLRMDDEGVLSLRRAGVELARAPTAFPADTPVDVTLQIRPGLAEDGTPMLFATAYAGGAAPVIAETAFKNQDDLETVLSACDEVPGLFLALAGNGDKVQVGRLEARLQECVNPNQFSVPDDEDSVLDAESLSIDGWAGGGVGAPSLLSTTYAGSDTRWDVLVDGTNIDRGTMFGLVGMAIGHATSTDWDTLPWTESSGTPKGGDDPPGCTDGTCDDNRSLREPGAYPVTNAGGELTAVIVAYAHEHEEAVSMGSRDVYELRAQMVGAAATSPIVPGAAIATVTPVDDVPCASLRDPALVPDSGSPTHGWWLFFTCEQTGARDSIGAVRLNSGLGFVSDSYTQVLAPGELGEWGQGGVRDPAVVAEYEDAGTGGAVYRLWFLARNRVGSAVTVAMAQAQASETPADGPLPAFEPYPSNPLLGSRDMPGCATAECYLTGIAVTRRAQERNTLRFLVARHVNGSAPRYELVPLEQFWRSPW